MNRPRGARLGAALVLATAALALLPALPASAHDYLVTSSPAPDSTVTTAIRSVSLTFDEGVLQFGRGSNGIVVLGAGGRHFETACATVVGATVRSPVALGGAGRYTVSWRVVSADGHPVSDSIAFTYRPPSGATAAAGSATGPDCGVSIARGSRFGAPGDTGGAPSSVGLVIGIAAGAALVIAAALVATVVVLRRTGRAAGDRPVDERDGGPPPAASG